MAILGKSKIEELEVGHGQSSTTPNTGAEIVHGGLGVEENLHVGGNFTAGNIEQTLTDDPNKIPSSAAVFEGTIKTATASAEKVDADASAEVEVTTVDRNSNFHFKIPSGNDGKTLLLQASSLFFRADNQGNITEEQTITLTVQSSNLNDPVTWNDSSIPAGTLSYTVTAPVGPSFNKTYTVTADGLTSTLTIGTINEGDSPYVLVPSTDSFVFSADSDGNVPANELTSIASFQILYGSEEESLSDWSISSVFQPTANFGGAVTAEGQISVNKFLPASDIGYITITATKGDITVSRTLRCTKAKSGETPIILALENDNYVFTVTGGLTPALNTTLPQAVSALRILKGNTEQTFTVGTAASGWAVSAVFTAIVNNISSVDASLFNGDIQADGTIRVTTLSPTLQYGEIVITASNTALGQTLNATVSIRLQESSGFGTPTATATTLDSGSNATASVSASGDDSAKVFSFNFGIPRGPNPLYLSLNPDVLPLLTNAAGSEPIDSDENWAVRTYPTIYEGGTPVQDTSSWTYEADYGTLGDYFEIAFNPENGIFGLLGWLSTKPSLSEFTSATVTITAKHITNEVVDATISKGLLIYKTRVADGPEGPQGPQGKNPTISGMTVAFSGDTSTGSASGSAVVTKGTEDDTTIPFNIALTLNNIYPKFYDQLNSETNGGVTPNAVRAALAQMTFNKAVYVNNMAAGVTASDYIIPNYTLGQDIEVFYNGMRLLEGTAEQGGDYTLNTSNGTITFNSTLGGTTVAQQLVVVARTLSSGGN